MRNHWAAALCALPLFGCASTINALSNMPITSDHLEEPGEGQKLKTVSGDRRLVRVSLVPGQAGTSHPADVYRICAETQADAIAARTGSSSGTVQDRGTFTDSLAEALTLTNQRGEVSDVVRQLSWQWCNAELNGMLLPGTYEKQMIELQWMAMETLKARAKPATAERQEGQGKGGDNTAECKPGSKDKKCQGKPETEQNKKGEQK